MRRREGNGAAGRTIHGVGIAAAYEEKSLLNYQGGGGNDDSFKRLTAVTITLAARNVSVAVLEAALGASSTAEAAGAVTGEAHTVAGHDLLITLDHMQDLSQPLTVEDSTGATTYVEGTDYIRKRGGIVPLASGALDADDSIKIDYTKHAGQRFQALLYTALEKDLYFDGINERTGAPWAAKFHRVNWSPTDSLELIGDDFAAFNITGEVLRDESIAGVGLSQFFRLDVGDL
jgi:hypothetical protein